MENFGGNVGTCGCLAGMDVPGYQLEGPIGFGADGATWLGRDGEGGAVAIRMLGAAAPERHGLRMGRLQRMTTVRSPHVAQLREVVATGPDRAAVVSEAVPGPTLATVRVGRGGLSIPETTRVGAELAAALRDLHAVGVVHADVSPANVVLSPGRGAVLVDLAGEPGWESGTGGFAAPELATGAVPTAAADIYALARLMVWLVADAQREEMRQMLSTALAGDPGERCSAVELHRRLSASPKQAVRTPAVPTLAGATLREHAQRDVTRRKSDHRPRHRRAPKRRPLLVVLGLFTPLAAAGAIWLAVAGADGLGSTDDVPHAGDRTGSDGGTGAGGPPPDPVRSAMQLTRERDAALNAGDVAALADLTVPGSPAAERDADLAGELSAGTLSIEGLRTEVVSAEVVSAEVVSAVQPAGPGVPATDDGLVQTELVRAELLAGEHTVFTPRGRSPAAAEDLCVVLEMHHHGERWRVAHVHHC